MRHAPCRPISVECFLFSDFIAEARVASQRSNWRRFGPRVLFFFHHRCPYVLSPAAKREEYINILTKGVYDRFLQLLSSAASSVVPFIRMQEILKDVPSNSCLSFLDEGV